MKQRGFALLTILPHIIGAITVGVLAWSAWSAANGWCNRVCREAEDRAASAEVLIAAAQKRATDLALMWADAIHKVETRYVEVVKWRTRTFVEYRERAANVEVSGSITLSPGAVGVLTDSANSANDPGASPGDQGSPQAVPVPAGNTETSAAEWLAFAVEAAEAYSDAKEKHAACVAWAGEISNADPK